MARFYGGPIIGAGFTMAVSCLGFVLSVVIVLGGYPLATRLHSISIFSIDIKETSVLSASHISVGVCGICNYSKHDNKYVLEGCFRSGHTGYSSLTTLLSGSSVLSMPEFDPYINYYSVADPCFEGVWAMLITAAALYCAAIICAIIGVFVTAIASWAVFLETIASVLNFIYSIILTAVAKNVVNQLNQGGGDAMHASFGGAAVGLTWMLFTLLVLLDLGLPLVWRRSTPACRSGHQRLIEKPHPQV